VTQPRFVTLIATSLLAGLLSPAFAAPPGPIGPDIRVGSGGYAACPTIAMGAGGDFEVVWNHYYSESHFIPQGVFARHFDRDGRPTQAAEIQLDLPGSSESSSSRVVALPGSGYFVTWAEYGTSRGTLVGRFLDSTGRPQGPVLRLRRSGEPSALAVVNDSLLVAWREGYQRPLRAQFFDLSGHPLGKPMLLSDSRFLGSVDLAPLADSFVAAWERWTGKALIVETQRFSLTGEPLGVPVRVNRRPLGGNLAEFRVEVASDGSDLFALGWTIREQRAELQSGQQVFDKETRARFFDTGGASSPEAHPNQLFTGNQETTGLAMNSRGLALVTWYSDRSSPVSSLDVVGRFLTPDGQPASKAFPLSQDLAGVQFCADAATNGSDDWVVTWLVQNDTIVARRLTSAADPALDN